MRYLRLALGLIAFFLFGLSHAQEANPLADLAWQRGPSEGLIGGKATIKVPPGYVFLGSADTKKFMEANHNVSSGQEYLLAPDSLQWFSLFSFDPIGYVKDNETIDADAVLDTVKEGTKQGNEERKRRGWSTMSIIGWRFKPHYDRDSKLLEWAFVGRNDSTGSDVINYNTRLLGRSGVMQVVLVADPRILDTAAATLKTMLTDKYQFTPGEKYAEFKQGDHVAEYGLAALVAGGAAAVAAKKGVFAVIGVFLAAAWKFVLAMVFGAFVWLKSLFGKKKSQ